MHNLLRRCARLRPYIPSSTVSLPLSLRTFSTSPLLLNEGETPSPPGAAAPSLADRLREKRHTTGSGPLDFSSSTPSLSPSPSPPRPSSRKAPRPRATATLPDAASVAVEDKAARERMRRAKKSRRQKDRKRERWEEEMGGLAQGEVEGQEEGGGGGAEAEAREGKGEEVEKGKGRVKAKGKGKGKAVAEQKGQEDDSVNPWDALKSALEKSAEEDAASKDPSSSSSSSTPSKKPHPLRAPYAALPFDERRNRGVLRAVSSAVSAPSTHARTRNLLVAKHAQLQALVALKKPWGELTHAQKYEEVGLAKRALIDAELNRRRNRGEPVTFDKSTHPLLSVFGYLTPPPLSPPSSSFTSPPSTPTPAGPTREVWIDIGKRLHARARKQWPERLRQIDKRIQWLLGQLTNLLGTANREALAVAARSGVVGELSGEAPGEGKDEGKLAGAVPPPFLPTRGKKGKGKEGEGEGGEVPWLERLALTAELGRAEGVRGVKALEKEVKGEKGAKEKQGDGAAVVEGKEGKGKGRKTKREATRAAKELAAGALPSHLASHPALQPSSSSPSSYFSPPPRDLSSYPHVLSPSSTPFTPQPPPLGPVPIATLAHSLPRALYNPGVHFLRDPRTGVYNFDPETLENVPKVEEFEFGKLPQYVTSSRDEVLMGIAEKEGRTFIGSTSSTVGMLCQIYFWLSKGKLLNTDMLSADFRDMDRSFSMGQQLPVSVVLNYNDGRYAIDADKSFDTTINSNILADYGHLMEKLLTTDAKEFKRFLVDAEDPAPSEADQKQAYHYALTDHLVLRSQLDAHDPHLPNKTFDLKTRGTVAIRQDRLNYEESAGYTIDKLHGAWESFEREYYDLIRSAFLKYQFQARIGHMDGVLVAYHSTARFFGFQYVPISEMDAALFGNSHTGEQVFKLALGVLEHVLREAAECFPGESVNVTWAADVENGEVLRVFVAPQKAVDELQAQVKAAAAAPEGEEGGDAAAAPSVEAVKGVPMTLLEIRGTNYLNGEAQAGPVTVVPTSSSSSSDASTPVWQVGYEITKSTGNEHLDFLSSPSHSSLDPFAATLPSAPVSADKIASLFAETRELQTMFSSLTLPTGVSLADVKAAAERAKDKGVELDASDLAVRFPLSEGVEYRNKPSRGVRALRVKAREGAARREEELRREGIEKPKRVQVVSHVEVVEAEQ
ncbi:hypothetical protein JCM6882_002721 [Rhodosporidiobolus microsporus]